MISTQQNQKIFHEGKSAIEPPDIGVQFKNNSVISRKLEDYMQTYNGQKNVIQGFNAAGRMIYGRCNVFIGTDTAYNLGKSTIKFVPSKNTFLGHEVGRDSILSEENIYIGFKGCTASDRNVRKKVRKFLKTAEGRGI